MSLTGRPLLVLLVALAALLPLVLILTWRRRPGGLTGQLVRLVGILLAQVLAVGAVGVWANNSFGFYDSWADLEGMPVGTLHAQTNGLLPASGSEGRLVQLAVKGGKSKAKGDVLVWLPPQYNQAAFRDVRFPVMMMMPGQPGTPEGVFQQFDFAKQATKAIKDGQIKPFVAVFPPIMIDPPRDTECTNVPKGPQAETWLATDVRNAVLAKLRVSADGRQWAAAGWSTGGFCAAKLVLHYPTEFHAAVSIGGYFDSETDHTTGPLFGNSAQLRRENSPIWLITQPANRNANLLIIVGKQDVHSYEGVFYADSKQMIDATRGYPNVSSIVLPTGGHNYTLYRQTLPAAFAWWAGAMNR